ncbi:GPI ethanolamine phosphate transferase 3, partial [Dorcoceras hygrometricum]
VKNYIDVYSSLSLIGFSEKDLLHVSELYDKAQELWSLTLKNSAINRTEGCFTLFPSVKKQIDAYTMFLSSVAALARSSWTEFNMKMMGLGFGIMLCSIFLHAFVIRRLEKQCENHSRTCGDLKSFFGVNFFALVLVLIRACSFLSNSFILEEGRVAGFLLATIVILQLRCAVMEKKRLIEALVFCILLPMLRIGIELGQLKQAVSSLFLKLDPSKTIGIGDDSQMWVHVSETLPVLSLIILAFLLYKSIAYFSQGILKYVTVVTFSNFILIPIYWASESGFVNLQMVLGIMKGNFIPRVIYASGLLQLSLVSISQLLDRERTSNWEEITVVKALALLSMWSSTNIILSGKQGPLVFLAFVIGGWCLTRLMILGQRADKCCSGSSISYVLPVTQWSLFAVCMFFSTGHWCAFDGLRYASAFIGFDEFKLIRQAILLTIDTFGFSHILPICGLPLLVATQKGQSKQVFSLRLCQVYLIYGLITAVTFTFTMLCVTIHRRHLMVWGLFAPKFVFDAVGLALIDFLIFISSFYYIL